MIKRILVANRGEIAVRVMRSCREMEITSIAVFSEADRTAKHVLYADEAYCIGPAASKESYLNIEKIIEEMIKLKKEIEDELEKGNEYDLSSEEKAFFDALGADPEIKELMQDETLVQIAKELVEIINENLTLDAFKREDARARIRVNIRRLLIKYNYPPVKREGAVEQVIRQAELKYANN